LIAGPILHHKEMMPQFARTGRFALTSGDVSLGMTWFLLGLAKKVLIADNLMAIADTTFGHAGSLTSLGAVAGVAVYSLQLYFDFSGYTDMAIGLARIFSIRFPLNFDSPFKSTSVTEFWQRWHITLTRYITLYLYNPILIAVQRHRIASGLKISRKALATPGGFVAMVAYPTVATMLLTGFWHGAGLQFLIFGLIHGIYLTVNQAWRHFRRGALVPPTGVARFAMMLGVFVQVNFALVFFRSSSTHAAFALLHDIAGGNGIGSLDSLAGSWPVLVLLPVVWFMPNTQQILGQEMATAVPIPGPSAPTTIAHEQAPTLFAGLRWSPTLGWGMLMAALFFAVLVELDRPAPFLYFQF
jgi:D-alanyl-lipoteichoic acid acyltransferase DltB (MBOAT superfamily)